MNDNILCRVLTGPTASGKSALGMELAEKHGWVIFCMDSMQIYRGMDIGTAKPTKADRERVPHEMLDLLDPSEIYSVSEYREEAEQKALKLWSEERKEVLFIGGTGLYLQALMHPMGMGTVPANEALRDELNEMAQTLEGKIHLHKMLELLDEVTAARLPVNDVRRTIRAIEVSRMTGIPFSRQPPRSETSRFRWNVAAAVMPREQLYNRINRRVLQMIENGLEDEVKGLLENGIRPDMQSMQGLGYKEMIRCLRGEWSMEKTISEIQKGTRHYAKRQETFLKRENTVKPFYIQDADACDQLERILL